MEKKSKGMYVQTHKAFCGIKERQVLTRIIKKKKHITHGKLKCIILNAINCVFILMRKL